MVHKRGKKMNYARLSFHDFMIQGPAKVGECGSTGSFRTVRRSDGLPVLLHRFRPALDILNHGPIIRNSETPDFTHPFLTRFTGIIEAAGSVYLVEPLPNAVAVESVWRSVLLQAPCEALSFLDAMVAQLTFVINNDVHEGIATRALSPQNIVLTEPGIYGILTWLLDSLEGSLEVRPTNGAAVGMIWHDRLSMVLDELLEIEKTMSAARGSSLLSSMDRQCISAIAVSVRNTPSSQPGVTS